MKRLFWIAAGAAAGVFVARKLTRVAKSFTPEGAAERVSGKVGGIGEAFREFADDVRTGMAERDNELRSALGIHNNGHEDPAYLQDIVESDHPRGT